MVDPAGIYTCKWAQTCKRFNRFRSAATLPVTIRAAGGSFKTVERLNPCTHGGGTGCLAWRRLTKQELNGRGRRHG